LYFLFKFGQCGPTLLKTVLFCTSKKL